MKEKVLEILEANKGACVSGSEIGKRLRLTRAAVWKYVKALKEEGCPISAVTNRGYCLAADADILSEAGIRRWLCTKWLGKQIVLYPVTDSTNLRAKEAAQAGAPAGLCVIAEEQTAGRGRFGRSFISPRGSGVYVSVLLRPDFELEQSALMTAAAAVCVAEAIEAVSDCDITIKWVNDLFSDGKKVCGILTEAAIEFESKKMEYAVIGIGVNLSNQKLPADLQKIAGGIASPQNRPERNRVIAEILNRLEACLEHFDAQSFLPEYRRRSLVLGKRVEFMQGGALATGLALEIDEKARLVVRLENGEIRRLHSGEISCKIL